MKTRRLLALIMALIAIFVFSACSNNSGGEEENKEPVNQVIEPVEGEKEEEKKPEVSPSEKPEEKPEVKPDEKPQSTPEPTPQETPEPQAATVGQKLLADFKAKAGSAQSALSLAEAIISNPVIEFSPATMEVQPGYLSGFGNVEIKGFKEGAMFGPMIGSVPFIGYVFFLEDGADVQGFVSNLRANGDLRWNICVEAEEMVTGTSGNKVFFVMSPKDFIEE